jgi:transcriptional regulator with XRE-family HTH domain
MLNKEQNQGLSMSQRKRQVLGRLLAKFRKKAGKSQMMLSQELGYNYAVVTHWENGTHRVPRKNLLEVQALLQIPGSQVKAFIDDAEVVVADHLHKPTGTRLIEGLGERMRMIRRHLELSTDDMATLMDMARTQYNRVELGRSNLTLSQMQTAKRLLHVTYEQLLGEEPLLLLPNKARSDDTHLDRYLSMASEVI